MYHIRQFGICRILKLVFRILRNIFFFQHTRLKVNLMFRLVGMSSQRWRQNALFLLVKGFVDFSVLCPVKKRNTGTPPLTRCLGPGKICVKGKPHYRRSILVLKTKNGEYESANSTFFSWFFHLFYSFMWIENRDISWIKDTDIDKHFWKQDCPLTFNAFVWN